jgi:enoyl-CoA hydratase/carnithine racemase
MAGQFVFLDWLDSLVVWISSLQGTIPAKYSFLTHKRRDIPAKECFDIGLANYMATPGETAFSKAMEIAKLLCSHPQRNLRNDRLSVYATYDWSSMLKTELQYGMDTLIDGLPQVKKFNAKL